MPVTDGFEATRQIRKYELESGGRTPIVIMTAYANHSREDALEAGADDFYQKPVLFHDVTEILQKWVPDWAAK